MGIADGALTSLALCWTIERADGAGLALTSHDAAVIRDGVEHAPTPGVTPAAITRSLGLEAASGEVAGALATDALDAGDLMLGRWNRARVRLSAVDWTTPELGAIGLLAGEIGEVALQGEAFSAELRGAAAKLDGPVCPSTSPECRARFGDQRCRVDLAGRTMVAHAVESSGGELLLDEVVESRFLLGRLRFMRGANCGFETAVIGLDGARVQVRDVPRGRVETGCRVELREGCDKRLQTCAERFGNAANFRGEPHLPGTDLLTRYPGA